MAMSAGDRGVAGSLANMLWNELHDQLGSPANEDDEAGREKICRALAKAIVDHITQHAEITVQISTSDGELQTVSGSPTDPPSEAQELNGEIE